LSPAGSSRRATRLYRAIDVDQPVIVDGHAVTFWEAVSDDGQRVRDNRGEVAKVIAQLHKLAAPENLHLPELEPFENAGDRIADSQWLTPGDRGYMTSELAKLQAEYARLDFALAPGIIHGDANIGNVLRDQRGNPVSDRLGRLRGRSERMDLIQTALFYDRYGWHTTRGIQDFCAPVRLRHHEVAGLCRASKCP